MDKLRALTFFSRTVEARSFTAAAQSLNVVPSALSKTIGALEREIGFTLFNRSTRKLSLTVEGEAYYTRCRLILAELEDAEAVARGGSVQPQGTLRVGMHPALRSVVFPEIGHLLESNPRMKVETFITNSPTALLDRGLDVVLCIGRLADSTLVARRVGWAHFVVCASPDYLRRWGEPRRPQDLVQHRAIIYARPDEEPNTQWEFTRGKERQVVTVPVGMVVRDGVGLVDAGAGGGGVLRPYEFAARRYVAAGSLKILMPEWSGSKHPVCAAFPNNRHVPAKVRAFVEFAQALVSNEQRPTGRRSQDRRALSANETSPDDPR
jgi:LysR family transcriptional regulator, regulator for bpeEF and oprC